jgi:hypothetical protein
METPDFYELLDVDKLSIKTYRDLFDDYHRRKADKKLQKIGREEKKQNGIQNNLHKYLKISLIFQECVVDYVSRIRTSEQLDPKLMTIFTEEQTIDNISTIRSDISPALESTIAGVLKLLKKVKSEDVDYEETVFNRIIQLYSAKTLTEYMKLLKKFSAPKSDKVAQKIPNVYIRLYEYLLKRFLKNFAEEEAGRQQLGGAVGEHIDNLSYLMNPANGVEDESIENMFDSHQFSEQHLQAEHFNFMQRAHDNYRKFKQSGGADENLQNLILLTKKEQTAYCRKYAKTHLNHPICKQFMGSVNELTAYLKTKLNQ